MPAPTDESFEQFYTEHRDVIGRTLGLTLGDATLAFEATDEAMARAFERWSVVVNHANPPGWVYRTGLNWARSWLRRRKLAASKDLLVAGRDASIDRPVNVDLARALQRLPIDQRSVVVLRFFRDWSVEETALALDIAPGTVKSRLSRALPTLRSALDAVDTARPATPRPTSMTDPEEA